MDVQTQSIDSQNTNTDMNEVLVTLTADIVSAYAGSPNNQIDPANLSSLITQVHSTLSGLGQTQEVEQPKQEPAVSIRKSVQPDYLICLEDGGKVKMLKRYIRTRFDLSPEEYRAKWGLPRDYPMVAPNYSEKRRELAKDIGLGTNRTRSGRKSSEDSATAKTPAKRASKAKAKTTETDSAPKRRGRPRKNKDADAA